MGALYATLKRTVAKTIKKKCQSRALRSSNTNSKGLIKEEYLYSIDWFEKVH